MNCILCGKELGKSLLILQDMPISAQNLSKFECSLMEDIDVRQCSFCGLVQLANNPVEYFKDVIRAGGISPSMRERQRESFKHFIHYFGLQGQLLLEVGSGRGEYLDILSECDVLALGLENNPAYTTAQIFQGYPSSDPVDLLGFKKDPMLFDAFISINFFEHVPNPGDFLRSVANLLVEEGVGMISVPDFNFELSKNFVFSFMRDHLSYFTSDSLANALSMNGFEVIRIFENQDLNTLTAYVKKRKQIDISVPHENSIRFITKMHNYLNTRHLNKVAVWGASHLAFSIIAYCRIKDRISYIVDSSPLKQGKFSPVTGIPIYSPMALRTNPVDSVLVMCPEYSDEIVKTLEDNYNVHIATFVDGELKVVK